MSAVEKMLAERFPGAEIKPEFIRALAAIPTKEARRAFLARLEQETMPGASPSEHALRQLDCGACEGTGWEYVSANTVKRCKCRGGR